jgi:NitT/TauT family transport system permease protein
MVTGIVRIVWGGQINGEIATTLLGVAAAALSAIVTGFLLGIAAHAWPRARASLDPFFATYYAVPIYVFYPMFLVLFGMNRIPIVVIGSLFAVVRFTMTAMRNIRPVFLKTSRVLRLGLVRTMWTVALPSTIPEVFTGIRLGFAGTMLGVLLSEMFGSKNGLGFMLINAIGLNQVNLILLAIDKRVHRRV